MEKRKRENERKRREREERKREITKTFGGWTSKLRNANGRVMHS